jgi:hypothetical protein
VISSNAFPRGAFNRLIELGQVHVRRKRAGEGNRTPDLLITSEPLCRLSYPGAKTPVDLHVYRSTSPHLSCTAIRERISVLRSSRGDDLRSLNDLTVMASSWQVHLEALNLSPETVRTYPTRFASSGMHPAAKGMPTAVDAIVAGARRELLGRGATANLGEHVGDPIPRPTAVFRMATG